MKNSNKKPIFNNSPNKKVTTEDNKKVYLSRSCSVVGEVFLYSIQEKKWYVLLGKRGENTPDFQGFWSFPCGYLDWDEKLYDAMCREVFEETGLSIYSLSNSDKVLNHINLPCENSEQILPWMISDNPTSSKQNIGMHYGILFSWKDTILPNLTTEFANQQEADDASWVAIDDALKLDLAFNHSNRLKTIWGNNHKSFEQIENNSAKSHIKDTCKTLVKELIGLKFNPSLLRQYISYQRTSLFDPDYFWDFQYNTDNDVIGLFKVKDGHETARFNYRMDEPNIIIEIHFSPISMDQIRQENKKATITSVSFDGLFNTYSQKFVHYNDLKSNLEYLLNHASTNQ